MNYKDLISSGDLELYIAGVLPVEESKKITELINKDENVRNEVLKIESAIQHISDQATTNENSNFAEVLKKVVIFQQKQKASQTKNKYKSSLTYLGWSAAAIFLIFLSIQYIFYKDSMVKLDEALTANQLLQNELKQQNTDANQKNKFLDLLISEETLKVRLAGQNIAPDSNVKVFWSKKNKKIAIDASTLPPAPDGMVYQIWSLKLSPLTPTSLGLLENYSETNNLFLLDNANLSEAFGITLEPAGGSKTPTLEKLFVLGTVS